MANELLRNPPKKPKAKTFNFFNHNTNRDLQFISHLQIFHDMTRILHSYQNKFILGDNTTLWEDYINPTADGNLSWKSGSSCTSDSGEELEKWQNQLHEILSKKCARITKAIRQVGTQS